MNMHVFCIMLILAQTLGLEQPCNFPAELVEKFKSNDLNKNSFLDLDEVKALFNGVKEKQSDTDITRDWYISLKVKNGMSSEVAGSFFDQFDRDNNKVISDSDFEDLMTVLDIDKNGKVDCEEGIRTWNEFTAKAGLTDEMQDSFYIKTPTRK